ncbi:DUF6814 family protein [Rurimicrobium arvi]|uniref:Uncharacterized protein n=1 Tax=Rurimicrobium arvi TaxID=2049916 RepID=A0ABP8N289_9BACT
MNAVKRMLGIVWIALAIACGYFGIMDFGWPKIAHAKGSDDTVFGIIILFVLTPIIVGGLLRFGTYALSGEYDTKD